MRYLQESDSKSCVELYFSDHSGLEVNKIIYSDPSFSRPRVSVLSDKSKIGQAYFTFNASPAVTALGLLFVRAAKIKSTKRSYSIPIISGNEHSLATELAQSLKHNASWLMDLFGTTERDSLLEIFHCGHAESIISVILSPSFFKSTTLSIILNNSSVSSSSTLSEIERGISAQARDSQGHARLKGSSIIPLHPSVITDEIRHLSSGEVSPKILEIFSKKLEERIVKSGVDVARNRLDELTKREIAYHLSQHTQIELVNENRDWKISHEFEVINSGYLPISKRTHQYWFEQPQGDIEFDIWDDTGSRINYSVVKSSEQYREICLELPRALGALERLKYRVSCQVKGTPKQENFYYLSPRTVTKNLSLSIKGYEGYKFENPRVAIETEGGFHKDDSPTPSLIEENGIETLHWTQLSPKPGELYRTFWKNHDPALIAEIQAKAVRPKEKKSRSLTLMEPRPRLEQ